MGDEQKRLEEGTLKDRGIARNLSSDDLESNGELVKWWTPQLVNNLGPPLACQFFYMLTGTWCTCIVQFLFLFFFMLNSYKYEICSHKEF